MNAQYPVGLGVRDELDKPFGVEVRLRSGVGGEGELSDIVLDVLGLELLLILTDPGDFRVGVHDRGNSAVVDVTIALADVLDNGNGLFLSLVGQHRTEGNVTNGTNVGDLSPVFLVNDDTAALVDLKANVLQAETVSVRAATDGDENNISIEL